MYRLSMTLVVLALTTTSSSVDGFLTPPGVPCLGNSVQSKLQLAVDTNTNRERETILHGILDDLLEEDASADDDDDQEDVDEQQVNLYHSLIFSSDLKTAISQKLDECNDPTFLEYLNASSESTQDEEERQGLRDLIHLIEEVKKETAKKKAEEEQAALVAKAKEETEQAIEPASERDEKQKPALSNADILKKANEIDAAIALSDDEKPSDFISDCREVVNLSRGFNDSGQMRVGGR